MQHYRLPTRLLDWSESPIIAAYFAVKDEKWKEHSGALYALSPAHLNAHQVKSNGVLTADQQPVISLVNGAFDMEAKPSSKILAVAPTEIDMRLLAQQSFFTIHGASTPIEDLEPDEFVIKFEIPAEAKKKILKQLSLLGITESNIFPDLEHLANELTDTYFP